MKTTIEQIGSDLSARFTDDDKNRLGALLRSDPRKNIPAIRELLRRCYPAAARITKVRIAETDDRTFQLDVDIEPRQGTALARRQPATVAAPATKRSTPAPAPDPSERAVFNAFGDALQKVFGAVASKQGQLAQPLLTAMQQLRAEVAELHIDSAARREHCTRRLEAALAARQAKPDMDDDRELLADMVSEMRGLRADMKKPQRVSVQREDGMVKEYYREQCEPADRPIINPALQ